MSLSITHNFVSGYSDGTDAGKLRPSDWNAAHVLTGIVSPAQGGTGLSSYVTGDLLAASGSSTFTPLAGVAAGQVLTSGGVGSAPAYSPNPKLSGTYGFTANTGSGIEANATYTRVLAPDGGAYLLISNQLIEFNSADVSLANGLTPLWTFKAPTVSGQVIVTNGAGSSGIGLDIATDGLFRIRTRAQTGDASVSALNVLASGYIEGTEISPPSAGAVNTGRLYFDNSGGKTRLMCIFNSGVAQQIAIQP